MNTFSKIAKFISSSSWDLLAVITIVLFGSWHILLLSNLPISLDEAYYWTWAQRLDTGYFDHPPLVGWLIGFTSWISGNTSFGIRLGALFNSFFGSFLIFHLTFLLFKDKCASFFSVLILNITPFFFIGTMIISPDNPLLMGWVVGLYCLWQAGKKGGIWWFLLGVAMGFSLLSKLTAILFFPCSLLWLLSTPKGRAWLKSPAPYFASLIALFLFFPFIKWNASHEWISFVFQSRHGMSTQDIEWKKALIYLGEQSLILSPFYFLLLAITYIAAFKKIFNCRKEDRYELFSSPNYFLICFSVPILLFFLFPAMRGKNELNWTAVAYIAGIVILGNACSRAIRDKKKYVNCLSHFGCGFSICINSVFSLLVLFPSILSIYPENRLVSEFFKSSELAKKVKNYRYDNKLEKSYIFAPSYQVASQLAFHGISLDHIKVIHSPKSRFSQYDIWNTSPIQQDAEILYISYDKELPDYVSNHFHISDAIITLPIFHYDLQIATEYLIPLRKNKEQDFTAKNSKIAIVLPTYNEYDNLLSMIEKLHTYVPNGRIIIVDDASPDGTGDLADQEASKNSLITVIHRRAKLGLGSAYVEGFQKAINMGYDIIVQMDADFSHDPAEVPSLINKLTNADVVVGSRYIENGSISNWNLVRKFTSIGGSLYARSILGFSYSDFTSGFKSWRASTLRAILNEDIKSKGYAFQIEMTVRAHKMGFNIAEIPIHFENRKMGASKMDLNIAIEAIQICWWLLGNMQEYRMQKP